MSIKSRDTFHATLAAAEHLTTDSSLLMAEARCCASTCGMSFWMTWSVIPCGNCWHSSFML